MRTWGHVGVYRDTRWYIGVHSFVGFLQAHVRVNQGVNRADSWSSGEYRQILSSIFEDHLFISLPAFYVLSLDLIFVTFAPGYQVFFPRSSDSCCGHFNKFNKQSTNTIQPIHTYKHVVISSVLLSLLLVLQLLV